MPTQAEIPLLRVHGLEKSFFATRPARDVSFDVHQGKIVSLLGENGVGKPTVIKTLAGIYKPDARKILLRGKERGSADSRKGMSFVHQRLGLVEWMTTSRPTHSPDEGDCRGQRRRCRAAGHASVAADRRQERAEDRRRVRPGQRLPRCLQGNLGKVT